MKLLNVFAKSCDCGRHAETDFNSNVVEILYNIDPIYLQTTNTDHDTISTPCKIVLPSIISLLNQAQQWWHPLAAG